jgi:AbiU2
MNTDQETNINEAVKSLSESLFKAWSYFHILRGFYEGHQSNPEVIKRFNWLFDQAWNAIFDSLFAKVGTLLDRTKGPHSLPNLVTLISRYGDDDLKQLLPEVKKYLSEENRALAKIKNWRDNAVAHSTAKGQGEAFYVDNKMGLTELENMLMELEEALNHLSRNTIGIHNDIRNGSTGLIEEGRSLFATLAAGIVNEPQSE